MAEVYLNTWQYTSLCCILPSICFFKEENSYGINFIKIKYLDKITQSKGVYIETFIIYAIGIGLSVFILYFIGILLAPFAPDSVKTDHFECGLPASSSTPKRANFGFFMFAIMFIVADMTGLFFTLFVYAKDFHAQIIASVFAVIVAIAITLSMKEYNHAQSI